VLGVDIPHAIMSLGKQHGHNHLPSHLPDTASDAVLCAVQVRDFASFSVVIRFQSSGCSSLPLSLC
jgi:hypothetical protein